MHRHHRKWSTNTGASAGRCPGRSNRIECSEEPGLAATVGSACSSSIPELSFGGMKVNVHCLADLSEVANVATGQNAIHWQCGFRRCPETRDSCLETSCLFGALFFGGDAGKARHACHFLSSLPLNY